MQQVRAEMPHISYPALLWREGYIYLATTPLSLCAYPRSLFNEAVQRARNGEFHLVDADGRYYDIVDLTVIPPFGGLKSIPYRLLWSIFSVPVLANESKLSVPKFKMTVACAVRGRYRYDTDKYPAVQAVRKLRAAESYRAAIDAVPKL
ncbi:hypothetical protein [Methylobacterium nonmethylotrophicum]|uniref:Uncharacterized protein n=1 Tax=Methylobacterium nonmethylotrophicum TaxID=1141884 RepID=A0A4Z0NR60_9HYPH|nr:hypothetical protein [Methylobacterium nonmethylotrophicum]TGD98673.1 hypothetical protein EU555_15140 [Methylobacterium nonmethylotrophicum]